MKQQEVIGLEAADIFQALDKGETVKGRYAAEFAGVLL